MHDNAFWQGIIDAKGAIPDGASLDELTQELLDYLRLEDEIKRDTYGYQILAYWMTQGHYDSDTLKGMMARWLGDLQHGIGDNGTTTVIVRSFAALMLSIIVYYDMRESFLSDDDIHTLLDAILAYFAAENDWRGHHPKYGWLHSVAHTADVLKFLARHEKTTVTDHQHIVDAIATKITTQHGVFLTHGEDERLALALLDVIKRGTLDESAWRAWVDTLVALQAESPAAFDNNWYSASQNTKHLMQSLYFALQRQDDDLAGRDMLMGLLLNGLQL